MTDDKMPKENQNPIHIKLDYSEAVDTKKDILTLQMRLLKINRTIREYGLYRNEEFELKSLLYKKAKEIKLNIGKLQKTLPKAKLPKILEKEDEEKSEKLSKTVRGPEGNIEDQLQEIQKRLNELQKRNV